MKKLLLFLIILLPNLLIAQGEAPSASDSPGKEKWPVLPTLPAREGKIYYEEAVELKPSVPQDSLYSAARNWLLEYYQTSKPELQVDEREAGQLMARADKHYQFFAGQDPQEKEYIIQLQHTLHIEVKDGQYRFRIYDFSARDEIRDLTLLSELDPGQGQVPEPRARRSAKGKKKRDEMFLEADYRSKLLTGLEQEVNTLIQSLKSAMAKAESAGS